MLNKTAIRVAAVGVMAASLIGASVTAASAAPGLNGSDAEVYIYDAGEETRFAPGTVHDWDAELIGVGSATDAYGRFQCSPDTESTRTFIAPRGQERTISAWTAYADGGFIPGSNKEVQQFPAKLSGQILGSASQVKANGGEYSLGMACLIYNGVALAKSGVFYAPITVEKGTGNWTVQEPTGTTTHTEPPAGAQTGDIDLEAVVPAPTDGALSLNVPAGAKATIGNATVVDGVSTATGTLPAFTVADARAASKPGWDLTATVADFTNAAANATIDKKQLGLKPSASVAAPAGISLGAEQKAGSSVYPAAFATSAAGTAVANLTLGGELTFVAPSDKPAGTYTSKMTLTLVSK